MRLSFLLATYLTFLHTPGRTTTIALLNLLQFIADVDPTSHLRQEWACGCRNPVRAFQNTSQKWNFSFDAENGADEKADNQ